MAFGWKIRSGRILGRDHVHVGRNCQDGCSHKTVVVDGQTFQIGVVSDGCGEGSFSEFAGLLLPVYIVNQIAHLLRFETPVSQVPVSLYPNVIGMLESVRKLVPFSESPEVVSFIKDHLLATVVGFVIGEEEGVVFNAGDGLWAINDEVSVLDHGNRSPYVAYHLLPRSVMVEGTGQLPRTFNSVSLDVGSLKRLTVTTDGFTPVLLQRMRQEARSVPLGLQLWMNVINGPRNPQPEAGRFSDDAAVVDVERAGE